MSYEDLQKLASRLRADYGCDNKERPIRDPSRSDEAFVDAFLNIRMRKEKQRLAKKLGFDSSVESRAEQNPEPQEMRSLLFDDEKNGFKDDQEREELLNDLEEMTLDDFQKKWGEHPLVKAFNKAIAK